MSCRSLILIGLTSEWGPDQNSLLPKVSTSSLLSACLAFSVSCDLVPTILQSPHLRDDFWFRVINVWKLISRSIALFCLIWFPIFSLNSRQVIDQELHGKPRAWLTRPDYRLDRTLIVKLESLCVVEMTLIRYAKDHFQNEHRMFLIRVDQPFKSIFTAWCHSYFMFYLTRKENCSPLVFLQLKVCRIICSLSCEVSSSTLTALVR